MPAPAKKKSKTALFIIIGAAVLVVALVAVLVGTKVFGLLGDKTTEQKKTEVTADAIMGTWTLETMEDGGDVINWAEYVELMELFGITDVVMEITFTEGQKGVVNFMGEVLTFTWENKGGGTYVLVDEIGDGLDVELKNGKLILDDRGGTIMTFVKGTSGSTASTTPGTTPTIPPTTTTGGESVTDMAYSLFGNDGTEYKGKYTGKAIDGLPEDTNGTLVLENGSTYIGGWKGGNRSGQGTMTWPEGRKYVGEWKDDLRNGFGTMTHPSGDVYVGDWKDNLYHGQGTYTWVNGQEYVGGFVDDLFSGQGTMVYTDGRKYVGTWKDDKRNGQGTMYHPDGDVYVGDWKDNLYHGKGVYTWASGQEYVGDFDMDMFSGQGTMTYVDGRKYVGGWKDDKRHGQGTAYDAAGNIVQQGEWKDGEFVG